MDAVGEIDLESQPAVRIFGHFVNSSGTEELTGIAILVGAARMADVGLQDMQMARLIFIVIRSGIVDIAQLVKGQLAIEGRFSAWRQVAIVIFPQLAHSRVAWPIAIPVAQSAAAGRSTLQTALRVARSLLLTTT